MEHSISPPRAQAPILDEVAAFRGLIEAGATASEAATEITADVRQAIEASDILRLMAPREVGGLEAEPELLIDVVKALSYADGSTGWYCGAVMTAGAVAGAFLGPRAVEAIFGGGGRALAAGQAAPQGRAERVGDSYRISGRFSFASGSPSARWVVGGYLLCEDGVPVRDAAGQPRMMIALAPRERVEFLGNWDVLGLRGTGSYDFHVPEQLVHEDFAFFPGDAEVRRGGALYRMGFMAIPCLVHAAFAIGCGRRVLDEWVAFASGKARPSGGCMNEAPTLHRDLAQAQGDLRAAEAYVRSTFAELYRWAKVGAVPEELKLDGRLCASHATRVAAQAGQAAFAACTTSALRAGSPIQRGYRDLQAGAAHVMTGEQSILELGRVMSGVEGASAVF